MLSESLKIYRPRRQSRSKTPIRTRKQRSIIRIPISDDALLESLAFHSHQSSDSFSHVDSEGQRFWSSDRTGVVSYANVSGHLKVSGRLLAKDEDKPQLLAEFLEFVNKNYRSVVFFNVTEADLPLFHQHSLSATKWGEEATIDLANWNCQGKAFRWLRRQRNYCTRHRVECAEWRHSLCSQDEFDATIAEFNLVADDSLKSDRLSGKPELLQAQLDFDRLGNKRIFVARAENGHGRIEAILVASPYRSGSGWTFETYQRRQDAVRGIAPFLKFTTIEALKAEGHAEVSLCLIPGLNRLDSREEGLGVVRQILRTAFGTAGLYQYKSRFRPAFEGRFVCTYTQPTAMTLLTSAYSLGMFRISLLQLFRRLWHRLTN